MLSIRAATIADVPLLRKLIQELAAYEREPTAVVITEDQLRRDGFGPGSELLDQLVGLLENARPLKAMAHLSDDSACLGMNGLGWLAGFADAGRRGLALVDQGQ